MGGEGNSEFWPKCEMSYSSLSSFPWYLGMWVSARSRRIFFPEGASHAPEKTGELFGRNILLAETTRHFHFFCTQFSATAGHENCTHTAAPTTRSSPFYALLIHLGLGWRLGGEEARARESKMRGDVASTESEEEEEEEKAKKLLNLLALWEEEKTPFPSLFLPWFSAFPAATANLPFSPSSSSSGLRPPPRFCSQGDLPPPTPSLPLNFFMPLLLLLPSEVQSADKQVGDSPTSAENPLKDRKGKEDGEVRSGKCKKGFPTCTRHAVNPSRKRRASTKNKGFSSPSSP